MDGELSKVDVAHAKLKILVTRYDLVSSERHLCVLPGQHLNIDELSDRVGASATPVRQALERLHGEGLIESVPKRGFFAKTPDATELQELYEFALLVLDRSLLKAQEMSTAGDLELDVRSAPGSWASDHQHNARFIEAVSERIVRHSRNGQMLRMIRNFHDRSHYVRCLALAHCPDVSTHFREISGLVDRLHAGQIDPARAILHAQMTHEITHLPEILRHARGRWAELAGDAGESGGTSKEPSPVRAVPPPQLGPGRRNLRSI
ncbi:GntR family transcriptional regulator [Bradyrhizobium sp. USDA 4353]